MANQTPKARVIALYLPQFHPIPENDAWWGKGFTEWTNVGKAKPLFKGHYQPRVPADLGYYDLRMPEVREAQAQMAREAGIEGFCYYHYWFGNGKQLLERPFNEVLASGKPDFPFCLCWANHTWSNKTWEKKSAFHVDTVLAEQQYLGVEDDTNHFYHLLTAFKDKRYMQIDGKPIFCIYDPYHFTNVTAFMDLWRKLAIENGLKGIYFIGMTSSTLSFQINAQGNRKTVYPNLESSAQVYNYVLSLGFDAVNSLGKRRGEMLANGKMYDLFKKAVRLVGLNIGADTFDYAKTVKNYFSPEDSWFNVYPTILPQWDRTARAASTEAIYVNATPSKFALHVQDALEVIKDKDIKDKIVFLKSWNEWAEGNYMEPDLKFGKGFIKALREAIY